MKKIYCIICGKYRKFEKPKVRYIFKKKQCFLLFAVSVRMKIKKYIKKKYWVSIEILKIIGLIKICNYLKICIKT